MECSMQPDTLRGSSICTAIKGPMQPCHCPCAAPATMQVWSHQLFNCRARSGSTKPMWLSQSITMLRQARTCCKYVELQLLTAGAVTTPECDGWNSSGLNSASNNSKHHENCQQSTCQSTTNSYDAQVPSLLQYNKASPSFQHKYPTQACSNGFSIMWHLPASNFSMDAEFCCTRHRHCLLPARQRLCRL